MAPDNGMSMAERGRRGGQARSKAKTAASRANGKKGGRPRKVKKVGPVGAPTPAA